MVRAARVDVPEVRGQRQCAAKVGRDRRRCDDEPGSNAPERIPWRTDFATATAEGLRRVAESVSSQGGREAMQLRVAEEYVRQFGNLARTGNTLVVPANLSDIAGMVALATKVFDQARPAAGTPAR